MSSELKITRYEDIKQDLVTFFRRKSLIPIVGAGISCGAQARNGQIPSGENYMRHMLGELEANELFSDEEREHLRKANFSTLCDYYEDDDNVTSDKRLLYLKKNFSKSKLDEDDVRRLFLK